MSYSLVPNDRQRADHRPPATHHFACGDSALRLKELEEKLLATHKSVVCALNQILDLKDLNTGVHSTRLAELALRVAQDLGVEECNLRQLEVAALLHDIGKVGVPDSVLNKPGRLTAEELALVRKHPEYGWAIVHLFPDLEEASLMILHHHENYDGTGYPGGLERDQIPFGARIVSVIDAFDAMVSSRPYRQGMPFEEAMRRLKAASGTQFDPEVVTRFVRLARSEILDLCVATGATGWEILE